MCACSRPSLHDSGGSILDNPHPLPNKKMDNGSPRRLLQCQIEVHPVVQHASKHAIWQVGGVWRAWAQRAGLELLVRTACGLPDLLEVSESRQAERTDARRPFPAAPAYLLGLSCPDNLMNLPVCLRDLTDSEPVSPDVEGVSELQQKVEV